ncbi:unnamed protein product [Rotaria sp. Silwood1]|nr:unnamed protein product [Rotaria sp. Silwood1]
MLVGHAQAQKSRSETTQEVTTATLPLLLFNQLMCHHHIKRSVSRSTNTVRCKQTLTVVLVNTRPRDIYGATYVGIAKPPIYCTGYQALAYMDEKSWKKFKFK